MILKRGISYLNILCLIGSFLLFLMASPSFAQSKRFKGSHTKNRKRNGGKRRNGVGKNIKSRKTRRQVKHRSHANHKQHKNKVARNKKVNKGGHKKNQIARKKKTTKRKNFGGRYPSSKNQFGTKLEGVIAVGGIGDNKITETENFRIDNVSENNNFGIHLSGGILWHVNNNLGIQIDGSYAQLPNEGTNMNLTGGNLQLKWNLISYNNKFSPFITLGGSIHNWEYKRKEFTEEIDTPISSSDNEDFVSVVTVRRNIDSYTSGSELLYGLKIGIGFDYKINDNIGTFVQVGWNYNQNFTNNNVKINFNNRNLYFNIGIKISLIKNKSLY